MRVCFSWLVILCWALPGGHADESPTARLEGTVRYQPDPMKPWRYSRYYVRDARRGELAEAVVCLVSERLPKLPNEQPRTVTIDQEDYRFQPETVAVRVGDVLRFTNSDPGLHNVSAQGTGEQFQVNLPHGEEYRHVLHKAGGIWRPLTIGCLFHSQMQAWVFVFDHPWYAVTGAEGRFSLEGMPPGTYRLVVVHPAGDLMKQTTLTLAAGESQQLEIVLTPRDKR
ncbi:MAG: hypothetical protein KatS3mg114_0549 [Planctomycetaceae bacterium]|nr:MAG: hypothetical protein KatS3mg114_0549 [Planctomycetaceae bacterium]